MVNQFARQIVEQARAYQEHAADLVRELEHHAAFLGLDETDDSGRLAIARRGHELLRTLTAAAGPSANGAKKTVEALAAFDLGPVNADRYGSSIKQAHSVAQALAAESWATLELANGLGVEGAALLNSLRGAARSDQRTTDLRAVLAETTQKVLALLKQRQKDETPPPAPPQPPQAPVTPEDVDLAGGSSHPPVRENRTQDNDTKPGVRRAGHRSGERRAPVSQALAVMKQELAELAQLEPDANVKITWQVVE
jgi:hypothetical protein